MNELVEQIKQARLSWKEAERIEIEDEYSNAILSIERAEAEGFYLGLKYAYVFLNGHDPIGDEDEE